MKKKAESTKVDQDARLLYVLLRYELGLDQAEFAAATRTAPSQVSLYDRGRRTVPDAALERAAVACGLPTSLLQPARRAIRSFRAARRSWSRTDRVLTESFFAELLELGGESIEVLVVAAPKSHSRATSSPKPEEGGLAADLWVRLEPRNPRQRLALVEELEDFWSWDLCELVAAKSIEKAPSSPLEALKLAELALRIAELCPNDEGLSRRAQGYAWFHVANARRVTNDLLGSDAALSTARRLWEAGAPGEPGKFQETLIHWIEATVRKDQRRFPEALRLIEDALSADQGELRGKLLLTKAQILAALGDVETAAEVLHEALAHIDEERDPRTALGVCFQFLICLCLEDRAAEAAPLLPRLQALGEKLNQAMDRVRLVWLGGKIAAGMGKAGEAENAFEQARRAFEAHKPPLAFNYALVSLDLALLYLEHDRTSQARILADGMAWIFTSQGVDREALAALQIFCETARREAATVELARRVIRFLHRSQHDPELRFEAKMEAEAS